MRITHGMFRALGEGLNVTPRILDLIRGMRSKITPGDEHFMSCYYDLHETPNTQHRGGRRSEIGYEMCYNLRHFEKHGRDLKDPWTCRQAVIHQRHLMAAHSDWVIIQPSIRWQASLDDVCIGRTTHPLALHIRSISSAIANNWEYLEYLSSQLLSLVSDLVPTSLLGPRVYTGVPWVGSACRLSAAAGQVRLRFHLESKGTLHPQEATSRQDHPRRNSPHRVRLHVARRRDPESRLGIKNGP